MAISANSMLKVKRTGLTAYIVFLMLPLYWLLNMSFKTNQEILSTFTLWPQDFTLDNYITIFTDPSWYNGYINSLTYVVMNMVIAISVALPAAYAFSRYKFLGDKHLFFWAAYQSHGAPCSVRSAVLSAVLGLRPDRYPYRRGTRSLPVQCAAGSLDTRGFHVRCAERDRRDRLYRWLFVPAFLREDFYPTYRFWNRRCCVSSASCFPGSSFSSLVP